MTSKKINYTHTLYNTETGFNRCLLKHIRTNKGVREYYYNNIIITPLYNYYNGIGILLKKGLIFPILNQRRKAHTVIVGFSIVAVCQMKDEAILLALLWELEHLAFFYSKNHRRTT